MYEAESAALKKVADDERNVADHFCRWLHQTEWLQEAVDKASLEEIAEAAEAAISAGPIRRRGRPPVIFYDHFISYVENQLQELGRSTANSRRSGQYKNDLVTLVWELEKVLPKHLRAGTETAVGERIEAARERRWGKIRRSA
jgi:hypothetical protein